VYYIHGTELLKLIFCRFIRVIIVKKNLKQFTTPFKDDIRHLTGLKQQI